MRSNSRIRSTGDTDFPSSVPAMLSTNRAIGASVTGV